MTWIRTVQPGTESPQLAQAIAEALSSYPPEYGAPNAAGGPLSPEVVNDSIVHTHSLIPAALKHVFAGYGAMLDPALPLSRRDHELIALTVSALNSCFY